MNKKLLSWGLAVLVVVLAWGYFIWPTPWVYYAVSSGAASPKLEHRRPYMVRRNRFTGELQWAQLGSAAGWKSK